MRFMTGSGGVPPPLGAIDSQKKSWFHAWAALLKIFLSLPWPRAVARMIDSRSVELSNFVPRISSLSCFT
jgi:hypothetical protein